MLYSKRRYTEDSILNSVQAIQMDCNAHGADECTSNTHVNNEYLFVDMLDKVVVVLLDNILIKSTMAF